MRLETFLALLLVPLSLGQNETDAQRSARTPQGHIQYDDPTGYKVSWKLYAPYAQWRSHLETPQPQPSESKTEQAETVPEAKSVKPQPQEAAVPVEEKKQQTQSEYPVEYRPYSMVPPHIKQLIFKMYQPQGPYIDPKVYIYHTPIAVKVEDQPRSAPVNQQLQSEQEERKADRRQESAPAQKEAVEQQPQSKHAAPVEQPDQAKSAAPVEQTAQPKSAAPVEQPSQQQYASYQPGFEQQVQQRIAAPALYQQHSIQEDLTGRYIPASEYFVSTYQHPILLKRKAQFAYGKYPSREVGHIEYKKEDSESKPAQYGFIPPQQQTVAESAPKAVHPVEPKAVEPTQHTEENNMHSLLQQLLNLQAQTPYYVIANRISYKPKKLFIPKPIYEDATGAYSYRSQVYYMKDENENLEKKPIEKPVQEAQRH